MFTFDARRLRTAGFALLALAPTLAATTEAHAQATAVPAPATRQAPPHLNPEILKRLGRPAPVTPPPPKLPANVLATVNGATITRDDLLGLLEMVHGKPLVSELIKDVVIENEAKRLGVVVTEAEIDTAMAQTKDRIVSSQLQRGAPMTYAQFAAENGITSNFLRWSVYQDTLRHATFLKTVQQAVQKAIPPLAQQRKLEHILILTAPTPGAAPTEQPTAADLAKKDAEAKTKIDSLLADIKAGKITFEDAARQNSEDKSNAGEGGLLGFAGRGTFVEAFENAAWKLTKPGEISDPVKSQFGWHIIKLVELGSAASPEEIKKYKADQQQSIDQRVNDPQEMGKWIASLTQNAKVVVNPSPVIVTNSKSPLLRTHIVPAKKTASK